MSDTTRSTPSWFKPPRGDDYVSRAAQKILRGGDHKPFGAKCRPDDGNPKGYNTLLDDHGHYGAGGSRHLKRLSAKAQRNHQAKVCKAEIASALNNHLD